MGDPKYQDIVTFEDKYWSTPSVEERRVFYIYSGSLTKHIIETYGKSYYMGLFNGKNLFFTEGDQGKEIVKEWIDKIKKRGV